MQRLIIAFSLWAVAATVAMAGETQLASIGPAFEIARPVTPLQATALARQTLLRIDDATRSGDYSVLRKLSAPSLRDRLSNDGFGTSLAQLRQQKVELLPAAVLEIAFDEASIDRTASEMRLAGRIATAPQQITFAFSFQAIEGNWLLAGLSVGLLNADKQTAVPPTPVSIKPSLK